MEKYFNDLRLEPRISEHYLSPCSLVVLHGCMQNRSWAEGTNDFLPSTSPQLLSRMVDDTYAQHECCSTIRSLLSVVHTDRIFKKRSLDKQFYQLTGGPAGAKVRVNMHSGSRKGEI